MHLTFQTTFQFNSMSSLTLVNHTPVISNFHAYERPSVVQDNLSDKFFNNSKHYVWQEPTLNDSLGAKSLTHDDPTVRSFVGDLPSNIKSSNGENQSAETSAQNPSDIRTLSKSIRRDEMSSVDSFNQSTDDDGDCFSLLPDSDAVPMGIDTCATPSLISSYTEMSDGVLDQVEKNESSSPLSFSSNDGAYEMRSSESMSSDNCCATTATQLHVNDFSTDDHLVALEKSIATNLVSTDVHPAYFDNDMTLSSSPNNDQSGARMSPMSDHLLQCLDEWDVEDGVNVITPDTEIIGDSTAILSLALHRGVQEELDSLFFRYCGHSVAEAILLEANCQDRLCSPCSCQSECSNDADVENLSDLGVPKRAEICQSVNETDWTCNNKCMYYCSEGCEANCRLQHNYSNERISLAFNECNLIDPCSVPYTTKPMNYDSSRPNPELLGYFPIVTAHGTKHVHRSILADPPHAWVDPSRNGSFANDSMRTSSVRTSPFCHYRLNTAASFYSHRANSNQRRPLIQHNRHHHQHPRYQHQERNSHSFFTLR